SYQGNDTSFNNPQQIGILFPDELASLGPPAGVTVSRPLGATDVSADYYQVQLLQAQEYFFSLSNVPAHVTEQISIYDVANQVWFGPSSAPLFPTLDAGTYIIKVSGWTGGSAGYDLHIALLGAAEGPVPLTSGPAPALRIRLAEFTPPTSPTNTPQVNLSGLPAGSGFESGALASLIGSQPGTLPGSAGPLGGVTVSGSRDAVPAGDGVVVQGPLSSLAEELLQLSILTQGAGADAAPAISLTPAAPATSTTAVGDYLHSLERTWEEALDVLFTHWPKIPALPAADPEAPAPSDAPVEDLDTDAGQPILLEGTR